MDPPTISVFATEMVSAKLIGRPAGHNNPSYLTIINQFTAGLVFKSEQSQFEQQCSGFFKILYDIGGPFEGACETIKNYLVEEVKRRLNIELRIMYIGSISCMPSNRFN